MRDTQILADMLVDPEGALRERSHWQLRAFELLVAVILWTLYVERQKTLARVYLPNERAFEPQQRQAYERFRLNETEIELIATAQRKRHYYYASPKGRRLFELALGPIALAFSAALDPAARAVIMALERKPSRTPFWRRFLRARQLGWVIEAIDATEPAAAPPATSQPLETV